MELHQYESQLIRLRTADGLELEGFGETYPPAYGFHEFGREEESVKLCGYQLFESDIASVEALGAADHVVIGLYDVEAKQYHRHTFDEPMEITSLLGNVSTKDGETYLHLHINLCRADMSVIGGHLNECRISATCEMIVRKLDGTVERKLDEAVTGLNLYEFL